MPQEMQEYDNQKPKKTKRKRSTSKKKTGTKKGGKKGAPKVNEDVPSPDAVGRSSNARLN